MIPVKPVPKPSNFDEEVCRRGTAWLAEHPGAERPHPYWTLCKPELEAGFEHRCGYSAMHVPPGEGTVDHFRSYKTHPQLAYDWSNYRYASHLMNASKKTAAVLDPYEVGEGWFEVKLPSLELVMTAKVPPEYVAIARETLRRLPIGHDERIMRQRRQWYASYQKGKITLEGLEYYAPLIGAAERKRLREAMENARGTVMRGGESPPAAPAAERAR
jgi:hypothetical protein